MNDDVIGNIVRQLPHTMRAGHTLLNKKTELDHFRPVPPLTNPVLSKYFPLPRL